MKNTFGNTISLTLFGESHGPAIGAVLDGLPPGLVIDESYIGNKLRQRRAQGMISTARQEEDRVEFVSGIFEGRTTGTPQRKGAQRGLRGRAQEPAGAPVPRGLYGLLQI